MSKLLNLIILASKYSPIEKPQTIKEKIEQINKLYDIIPFFSNENNSMLFIMAVSFAIPVYSTRMISHGLNHIVDVLYNCKLLLSNWKDNIIITDEMKKIIFLVALFHDYSDSKYDKYGIHELALKKWLRENINEDADMIYKIIYNISFSKEKKNRDLDPTFSWDYIFPNQNDMIIRHVVSDADKLAAIGTNGIIRCIYYNFERYFEENPELSFDKLSYKQYIELYRNDVLIYVDKLFLINKEYIFTLAGKIYGEMYEKEMIGDRENLLDFIHVLENYIPK